MIISAKKIENNWVFCNECGEIIAKAKIEEKKTGIYGKIIYCDAFEQEILFNTFACINGRLKVNVFESNTQKTALYRDKKLDKNKKQYFCYRFKYDNCSYYGYNVKSNNGKSDLYIYHKNELIAVMSIIKQAQFLHIDIFACDYVSVKMLIAYVITHQILSTKKHLLVNEYVLQPLNIDDKFFVGKIKELLLREPEL